jgi:hypothetical protein
MSVAMVTTAETSPSTSRSGNLTMRKVRSSRPSGSGMTIIAS